MRYLGQKIAIIALVGFAMGCGKTHPVKVFVDPSMKDGTVEKVAVLPFTSSLHRSDDPDDIASKTMDELFLGQLESRKDYKFSSPQSVSYVIDKAGLGEAAAKFADDWRKHQQVDTVFLSKLSKELQVDGVLIGVVDVWQKDEVDYREASGTPTTYVGATVTLLGVNSGAILFQASDEDFLESATSEASDRGVKTSTLGAVRSDSGGRIYKAPRHQDVAIKVVRALVASLPKR